MLYYFPWWQMSLAIEEKQQTECNWVIYGILSTYPKNQSLTLLSIGKIPHSQKSVRERIQDGDWDKAADLTSS
jgi:hypothetical protein